MSCRRVFLFVVWFSARVDCTDKQPASDQVAKRDVYNMIQGGIWFIV